MLFFHYASVDYYRTIIRMHFIYNKDTHNVHVEKAAYFSIETWFDVGLGLMSWFDVKTWFDVGC